MTNAQKRQAISEDPTYQVLVEVIEKLKKEVKWSPQIN